MRKDLVKSLKEELARSILDLDLVDSNEYAKYSTHAKNSDQNVYDLLVKDQVFKEKDFIFKLSTKFGVDVDSQPQLIDPSIVSVPKKFSEENFIAILESDDKTVNIAVCTPSSLNSVKNLSLITGKKVKTFFTEPENIFSYFQIKTESKKPVEKLEATKVESTTSNNDENIIPEENINIEALKDTPKQKQEQKIKLSSDVVKAVDEIFSYAIDNSISDMHFEIFRDRSDIRFRKNGTLIRLPDYDDFVSKNYNAVVARIKILANLDIAERRLPQDGKIAFTSKSGTDVDLRVSVLPTNLGERVVIRVLNSSNLALSVDKLGFSNQQLKDFLSAIEAPQGMVLVTGPTGSGKSTTLYGAINHLNSPDVNILTAEDPVEYTLSGISQVQVRDDIGLTFASALRSFLRQDPEIILVGEIRDTETADIATKAALTGHLVLSTLHTNSAAGAISRLINMGLPPYLISSSLSLVVAQRLIRTNCEHCLTSSDIENEAAQEIINEFKELKNIKLKHSKGCPKCFDSGFSGRRAIHEVLRVSPKIQKAIAQQASEQQILNIAIGENFVSMRETSINLLKEGTLSLSEFLRSVPQSNFEDDE